MMNNLKYIFLFIIIFTFTNCSVNKTTVTWENKVFKKGDRVVVTDTLQISEFKKIPGYSFGVVIDSGRTGTIIRGVKRKKSIRETKDESLQSLLIEWDEQSWRQYDNRSNIIKVKKFRAGIHACWIKVINNP
jgi:hypothetical protein